MTQSLLRLPQVMARTGLGRSAIYGRIQNGGFPSPVQIGPRAVGWIDTEIDEWVATRIKASRAQKTVGPDGPATA